jgi:glycosyltransferase involved in cell wall biosynthesis
MINNKTSLDVSISLCTYKRVLLLRQCLEHLIHQETSRRFEIVVVDNDAEGSAETVVNSFRENAEKMKIPLSYFIEPVQNLVLARNKGIAECSGRYVAFIDDDEYAIAGWLERLCKTADVYGVDGVFGPVIPVVRETFPKWIKKSNLFDRPRMKTGKRLQIFGGATGNALIKRDVLLTRHGPFDFHYGKIGGEDTFLFSWLMNRGYCFCWCDEAVVCEIIEEKRKFITWHIRRGYRGGWGYARTLIALRGNLWGTVLLTGSVFSGSVKLLLRSLMSLQNPRAALVVFLSSVAGQMGKLGYFLDITIEEYQSR